VLARNGPLPTDHVRAIMRDVLSALSAAHSSGVLHRDIKPANILFTHHGGVKIADFGVAKSPDTPQTLTNRVFGTMAYLPSDRIAGRPATPSDDLYALGVVAYEALTARRAYPQENLTALADAIAAGQLAPLSTLRPDIDPALATTIERSMARDPRWRFASADQMRASLDAPAQRPRRTGAVLASAAILLVFALAALLIAV
jgi:eukaryotic-like serine/threonine-protein kinase